MVINDQNRHEDYFGDQQMILGSQAFSAKMGVKQGHVLGTWCVLKTTFSIIFEVAADQYKCHIHPSAHQGRMQKVGI